MSNHNNKQKNKRITVNTIWHSQEFMQCMLWQIASLLTQVYFSYTTTRMERNVIHGFGQKYSLCSFYRSTDQLRQQKIFIPQKQDFVLAEFKLVIMPHHWWRYTSSKNTNNVTTCMSTWSQNRRLPQAVGNNTTWTADPIRWDTGRGERWKEGNYYFVMPFIIQTLKCNRGEDDVTTRFFCWN